MKQLSLILNIALTIAVAVLYYLHFTKGSKNAECKGHTLYKDTAGILQTPQIAYVDLDSFYNNVGHIKAQKAMLDVEQKNIQLTYENAYKDLENERLNFLKKGAAISQKEEEEFRNKLMQKQQEIESKKQVNIQQLSEKNSAIMYETQTKLKKFLAEYNKDKRYKYILATGIGYDYIFYKDSTQNITAEIVKGLNEEMNKKAKQ
jgi:outer membrane protein